MFESGFLTGLIAKFAGLGSVAKAAIATATAALTMTVAGGAVGVLPVPGGASGPTVTVTTEPAGPVEGAAVSTTSGGPDVSATTPTTGGSTSAGAAVGTAETPEVTIPPVTIPPVTVPGGGSLPDLSGLAQVPGQVLACLAPVLDLVTGMPSPAQLGQISQLGTTIAACVTDIVADLPLPTGINTCISNIMAFVRNLVSQLPSGTPDLSGFDVAACIPAGLPVPTGLAGMPFMGDGFPFGR